MIGLLDHSLRAIRDEVQKRTAECRTRNIECRSEPSSFCGSLFDIRYSSFLCRSFTVSFSLLVFFCGEALAVPSYEEVRSSHRKSDSLLLDRHGEVIHELKSECRREAARLDSPSRHFPCLAGGGGPGGGQEVLPSRRCGLPGHDRRPDQGRDVGEFQGSQHHYDAACR